MQIIRGKVKKGAQRGRVIGFPTANVNLHRKVPQGIYISLTSYNKVVYPSLTFIGNATTFNEKDYKSETYLFSFNQTIYNRWVSIKLLKKIRENKKFKSIEELKKEMENDRKIALSYFEKKGKEVPLYKL